LHIDEAWADSCALVSLIARDALSR